MLHLMPHVRLARVGEDLVLMDLAQDAYLCLPQAAPGLALWPDGRLLPADPALAADLVAAGYASTSAQPAQAPPPPKPSRALEPVPPALGLSDGMRLLGCLLDLARHYRGRPLPEILEFIARRRRRLVVRRADPAVLAPLISSFEHGAAWLPAPRKCLARSFLLLAFLHRQGLDADWVFAVRTWPFDAHCWLQLGEVALDEAPERLAAYQPILVA
jgi:hypothetical protein